ncbi:5'-3' exonuclease H3TH domain-containing protein [Pseudoalteromonas sp. KJ10-2]|uniref:5'-3' exonuclease H3TH domain-containing protein n=1 Tax=Psychromonas sp. KJ10-2 TaxID=3391822 RepID=UPI0039B4785A
MTDYWAITGISSSNIKGVEGVGNKGAMALLQEHASLQAMFDIANSSDKRLLKVQQQQQEAILSKQLVSLKKDIQLGFNLKDLRYPKT